MSLRQQPLVVDPGGPRSHGGDLSEPRSPPSATESGEFPAQSHDSPPIRECPASQARETPVQKDSGVVLQKLDSVSDPSLLSDEDLCSFLASPEDSEKRISSRIEDLTGRLPSNPERFVDILPYGQLLQYLNQFQNQGMASNIALIFSQVSKKSPPKNSFRELIPQICTAAQKSRSPADLQMTLCHLIRSEEHLRPEIESSLEYLWKNVETAEAPLRHEILDTFAHLAQRADFGEYFVKTIDLAPVIAQNTNPETHARLMQLALALLPSPTVLTPFKLPRAVKCELSNDFAKRIQGPLQQSLIERPLAIALTLLAFAATFSAQRISLSNELVMSLLHFPSISACFAPCVLAILSFFTDGAQSDVTDRILSELECTTPPPAFEKWYRGGLAHLRTKIKQRPVPDYSLWTLTDFNCAAASGTLEWLPFLTQGGIDRCAQLAKETVETVDVQALVEFCSGLLSLCPLPENRGPSSSYQSLQLLLAEQTVTVRLPSDQLLQVRAPLYTPISLIEGLINDAQRREDRPRITASLQERGLAGLVRIQGDLPCSHISALARAVIDDYPAIGLRTGEHRYGVGDTMLSLVCDHYETKNVPELAAEDAFEAHAFPLFRPFRSQFFNPLLEFLSVSAARFSLPSQNPAFVHRVKDAMQFPLNSLGRLSPAFALIFQYPDLFPYSVRSLAFQLCALDPLAGLARLVAEFSPGDSVLLPSQVGLQLVVNRERIREDGTEILRRFSGNKLPLDLHFSDEPGHGPGVAREFFALLSQAFLDDEALWHRDKSQGAFPAPRADPPAFADIGVLVAKALSMGCLLELPLSPAFLALARGDAAELGDVDAALARTLAGDLTGAPFECPGYPDIFARDGEEVTAENRDEFVALVTEAIVGQRARDCAAAFKKGFERVMSFELLDVFTTEEITTLVMGQNGGLNARDFELNGYQDQDSAIVALREVIDEFNEDQSAKFLKFVTGAAHLPVGGVAALKPRLSVLRMEKAGIDTDDLLPTSAVCINALKLPPYSNKDRLRSKLLLAMTDGKDSFLLD